MSQSLLSPIERGCGNRVVRTDGCQRRLQVTDDGYTLIVDDSFTYQAVLSH